MQENKTKIEIFNVEELKKYIVSNINEIIKDSTYAELHKYLEMLPFGFLNEEQLCQWGCSYLNEYYKIIGRLEKLEGEEIEELKYKIYILYLKVNYNKIKFTYQEFITFSKLLNTTFSEYNTEKMRKSDKEPYQSDNKEVDDIVNRISKEVLHSSHPNAYEITKFKLVILKDTLSNKCSQLLKDEFDKIDLNDELLSNILSESALKKLKSKNK